jgi:hypothetical protein
MPTFSWKDEDLGEFDEPTFNEIRAIKKWTGMIPGSPDWEKAQENGDPDCLQAVIYLLLHRKGRMVKYSEIDGKPSDFGTHYTDEEKADAASAAAERVAPTTKRILQRVAAEADIPFNLDDDKVLAIVTEEFERSAKEQEAEGKEQSEPSGQSNPTKSSDDGPADSGNSSA